MTVIGGLAVIVPTVVLSGQRCGDRPRTMVSWGDAYGAAYAYAIMLALFVVGFVLLIVGMRLLMKARPVPTPPAREPSVAPPRKKADVYWPRKVGLRGEDGAGPRTPETG